MIIWRVAVVAAAPGQFVPFRRQTEDPFTAIEETRREVPEAVAKLNQFEEVPFVKERFVTVPFEAFTVPAPSDPIVAVLPKRLEDVTVEPLIHVPVAPVKERDGTVRREIRTFVAVRFVAKRFVLVVLVPVASVQRRFTNEAGVKPEIVREEAVKLVNVPLVAKKLVDVALVDVVFVKTPVEGVVAPIEDPLMETPLKDPPEMEALEEMRLGAVREAMNPFVAFTVVPEAMAKPNQEVEVPFVKERLEEERVVTVPFVAKSVVAVAFAAINVLIEVPPFTFNAPWIVNDPVDVPPANWIAFVVTLPTFVTVWNVPLDDPNCTQLDDSASK